MHVLFANNYYYLRGGSERVLVDEMTLLEEHGHKTNIFSQLHPETFECEDREYFSPYVNLNTVGMAQKIKAAPATLYNRKAKRLLQQMLQDKKPDLLHGHNIYGGLTTSIFDAAKKAEIPSVLTLHDLRLVCPAYLMLRRSEICEKCKHGAFYHCLKHRCVKDGNLLGSLLYTIEAYYTKWLKRYNIPKMLITPSAFLREKVLEGGYSPDHVVHIANMVPVDQYEPNSEPGDYALFVGRLSHEKGLFVLLEAFSHSSIPLRIAGTGSETENAKKFVEENEMSNVTFEGYSSGEKLENLYRNSAFLVIPSTWYENCPMSVIEAMAYGKPVIGSRIGGIPELVTDNVTGRLSLAGHSESLLEIVNELWNDREKLRVMGNEARKKVCQFNSPQVHYEQLYDIYQKVLS